MKNEEKINQEVFEKIEYFKKHNLKIDLEFDELEQLLTYDTKYRLNRIADYKLRDPINKQNFANETYISSLFHLSNFDIKLADLIRPVILDISCTFSAVMHFFLSAVLDKEELKEYGLLFENITSFNDVQNNLNDRDSFIYLFNDHKKSGRKKIKKFISYLVNNKDKILTKTLDELYNEYYEKFGIKNFHNDFNKIFSIDSANKIISELPKLHKFIFTENGSVTAFNDLFQEFIINDIKDLMISNLEENNLVQYKPYTQQPICTLFEALSFKQQVQLFDSLNKKIKYSIIDYSFISENLKWDPATKINTFSSIMHIFPKVRRIVVNPRIIYAYQIENKEVAKLIYDFISLNDKKSIGKICKNKVNWYSILWCMDTFQNNKISSMNKKKLVPSTELLYKIHIAYKKSPKQYSEFMKRQFGFTNK